MKLRLMQRSLLLAVGLLLSLSATEIAAQQEERQEAVGDIPLNTGADDIDTDMDTTDTDMDNDIVMTNMTGLVDNSTMAGSNSSNISVPTAAPTFATSPPTTAAGCYDNLDAVFFDISDDDKLFQQKLFIICPGTVVDIGFLVMGTGIDNGQAPIIPRSNTEYRCGENGSVNNKCILRGGDFALIGVPVFFRQDLSVNNVLIKGFTFEGQAQYSVFMAVKGDIVIEDCLFRDQAGFAAVIINYDSQLDMGGTRLLEEESDDPFVRAASFVQNYHNNEDSRRLAAKEEEGEVDDEKAAFSTAKSNDMGRALQADILEVVIRDTLFTNIQQIERKLGVEFGVISIKGTDHNVTIQDTTIANVKFGNQELTPIGYAILVQGAEIGIHGLCLIDNDFRGSGAVLLEQTANPFAPGANFITKNYATEGDDDLECEFAAYFATDEDRRNSNFACIPVQVDACGGGDPVVEEEEDSSARSVLTPLTLLIITGVLCTMLLS